MLCAVHLKGLQTLPPLQLCSPGPRRCRLRLRHSHQHMPRWRAAGKNTCESTGESGRAGAEDDIWKLLMSRE